MGEYRRFVSYLYEYRNEKKEKIAGAVRVDCRGVRTQIRDRCARKPEPRTGGAAGIRSSRAAVGNGSAKCGRRRRELYVEARKRAAGVRCVLRAGDSL